MAVTYYEIVIKGNGKLLKGFVRGYQIGRSIVGGLLYCGDLPIDTHHLKRILTMRGDHIHLICTARVRRGFLDAVKQATDLEFEILSDVTVAGTHFEFKFDAFNRDVASEIERLLKTVPPGLKLVDYEPKESVDSEAKGVELYSPVHEYRFRGRGRIRGDVEKLLAFRATLAENKFLELEDITIEH